MFIKRMQPSFTYNNHEIIFNYCVQNILMEVINKNKEKLIDVNGIKVLIFNKDSFIVYLSPDLDRNFFDNISNVLNINNYNYAVAHALNNDGVFVRINGINPLELSEGLSEHTGLSLNYILDTYKSNFAEIEDIAKVNCGKFLSESIPKLYKLAKETNQVKYDDCNNYNIKTYCDCDFSVYTYNEKFMINCAASANLYYVEFNDTGFKVYGHSNSYGKYLEKSANPDFEWDTAEYEPYYLKYLTENMVIMTVDNDNIKVESSLVSMLNSIIDFIIKEENL